MKQFFLIVSILLSFSSFGQVQPAIKNVHAFYYIPLPGIIGVDLDGNPLKVKRDTVYRIFVEVKGTVPKWKAAWKGGKTYLISAIPQKNFPVKAGETTDDGMPINITPRKGNSLWELEFGAPTSTEINKGIKSNEIMLEGVFKNKIFYKKAIPTHIASPLYQ